MSDLSASEPSSLFDKANLRNPPNEARRQQLWIQECLSTHRECIPLSTKPFLPTRLLEVRNYPSVRLVNTSNLDTEDSRYTALSYCWGDSMPIDGKTTLQMLESHQQEVVLEKLPRTMRNAVEVIVSWSIPYIWIDALCIIQDVTLDWHQESGDMALVYSHATATIAASVSDHCDGGFLSEPPLYYDDLAAIPGAFTLGELQDYMSSKTLQNTVPTNIDRWKSAFFKTPLFNRGWTLQERELSPRPIHFTTSRVIFECRVNIFRYELEIADLLPSIEPYSHRAYGILDSAEWQRRILDNLSSKILNFNSLTFDIKWYSIWQRTVGEYSRRKFKDPTDKLPAIAGLADAFERKVKSGYLAGLWKNNLAENLLWMTISPLSPNFELDQRQYIAPSWSWASSSRPVKYTRSQISNRSQSITILECIVNRMGSNEKGKLAGGYLKVRCLARIFRGTCRKMRMTESNFGFPLSNRDRPQQHSGEPLLRIYDVGDEMDEIWIYWDKKTDLDIRQDVFICVVNIEAPRYG